MKRLIFVLTVFVLVSAPTITGIWILIVPKYQARGEIRVRPIIPRLVFQTEENGVIPFYDSFVNTQVSVIRSLTVLQRVLDQQEVQRTQWYKNPPRSFAERLSGDSIPLVERLRESLSAQPRPRTEIVDVSFADPVAKDAKLIVDTVLQQYLKYIGEQSSATEDKLYRELTAQYSSLGMEIQSREKTCTDLCRSLGANAPQELISSKRVRLDETQARLSEMRNKIAALEWQVKQIGADSNDVSAARTNGIEKQPKYHEDAEWRKLDISARTIRHNLAAGQLDPNDPVAIRARKDVEFAQELLRLREAQLDEQWRDRSNSVPGSPITTTNGRGSGERAVPVEYQLALAKHEEQFLQADLDKQQGEFRSLFEIAQSLERENTELRHKRELFDAVRQRLDHKNMERNVPGSIEVSTWAFSPSKPARDRQVAFTAVAMVLALCVAAGATLLTRKKA